MINFFLYVIFIFLKFILAAPGFHCCTWASHWGWGGASRCGVQALGFGPVEVVHRLSCLAAGGICLDQTSNLCPLHWQVDS